VYINSGTDTVTVLIFKSETVKSSYRLFMSMDSTGIYFVMTPILDYVILKEHEIL
jgi:hypothetical protein